MTYDYRSDPVLGPVLAYWCEKRGPRAMPRKRDMDPTELAPKLLPNLQIIEVLDGGARFRYRLVGTASVDAYGSDYTGLCPDELFADDRVVFIQDIYRSVCRLQVPLFTQNRYHTPKNVDVFAYRVYMPLSSDGSVVDFIFGVLSFQTGGTALEAAWREVARLDPTGQYIEPIDPAAIAA
ncbi:MAG: PAS domain-containing protein [Alphaproteobacteria bacterium]|nr:PAS domain-containing protein [Alphaproteobacteria bacterium]